MNRIHVTTVNVITVLAIVITVVRQSSKVWKKTRGELRLKGLSPGELFLSATQKKSKPSTIIQRANPPQKRYISVRKKPYVTFSKKLLFSERKKKQTLNFQKSYISEKNKQTRVTLIFKKVTFQ